MYPRVNNLSSAGLAFRVAAAGLLAGVILGITSYLINVLWLGPAHDALDVFRSEDDPLRMPGLMVSAFVWGSLLAGGYRIFWRRSTARAGWIEGATYGLLVSVFFTSIQSVFLFQFIRITADLFLGDILHYLLASTVAGALIGKLVPPRVPAQCASE
jgi:hypothetical protein